jgi:hypothetical protein
MGSGDGEVDDLGEEEGERERERERRTLSAASARSTSLVCHSMSFCWVLHKRGGRGVHISVYIIIY